MAIILLLSQELRLRPPASWAGNYRRWRSHWRSRLICLQLHHACSTPRTSFTSSTSRITSAPGDQLQEFISLSHLINAGIQCRFITAHSLNTLILMDHRNVSLDVVPTGVQLVLRGPAGTFWKVNAEITSLMVSEAHDVMYPSVTPHIKHFINHTWICYKWITSFMYLLQITQSDIHGRKKM